MNCHSMAHDVKTAILRAKHKISSLENELCAKRESCSEGEEENHQTPWKLKQELKDSLVDMYKAWDILVQCDLKHCILEMGGGQDLKQDLT
ncbi:mirror-image polydactyly gene 1 protein isoform X1 [Tachysurus ichikawai]